MRAAGGRQGLGPGRSRWGESWVWRHPWEATAGPTDSVLQPELGLFRYWEAGCGSEELGCRNFGVYKRRRELSQKSLFAGTREMQPGETAMPAEAAMWEAEAGPPQIGLSRPTCSLPASSPGPALPPGCVSRPDSGLPTTSLDSAPAQLPAALVGPPLPEAKLPRPSSGLRVASPGSAPALQWQGQWAPLGPAWASRRPLQAQIVLKSVSPGPAPASRRPLQAQVVVKSAWNWAWKSSKSASPGPAPSSRRPLQVQNFLESASPGPAPPASQWPLSAQTSSWLLAAFPGPAFDFWWPLQAQNLTSSGPLQARPPASRWPARAQTHSGLTADSPCPASSRLIVVSRVQSSCLGRFSRPSSRLPVGSLGPAHSSQRPSQAPFFPSASRLASKLFIFCV
ncbi:putative uncharacterized protein FLJ44672 [Gorilla gorilla gorilla]|uniref:putative uncharacterized protein FLJ44672 n=1 Tax=Gorilla gorilla gorilla TaxID=9595 RepID=UPI00300B7F06